MINKEMTALGKSPSAIRELFEFGKQRAALVGRENVFDFSLGNPSVPPPQQVQKAMLDILRESDPIAVHGYTSAPGDVAARSAIADSLNRRFGTHFTHRNICMTCGAASSLTACLKALSVDENSEFIAIAPYFPEYGQFAAIAGGSLRVVPADIRDFQIDFDNLEALINKNTQAVIVNSPNNPSGVVYTEATIKRLAQLLDAKSRELGHTIYILSDEPYRELVYDGVQVPFITNYYANTIVCYSFSKSLSLPGERIGYMLVPDEIDEFEDICAATMGSLRRMGYVCAPSFMQMVLARCMDVQPDLETYRRNRELLYNSLMEIGYRCVKPSGAFYLFVESPGGDAKAFSEAAKRHDVLVVAGNDFGCSTHFRLCYCVSYDTIRRSLPAFKALYQESKR
ncbi:MAG: pyridoxal phosphate-dependent aminotransferase [Clostridia bacterium]